MACFHPLTAYRGNDFTKNGKRRMVFDKSKSLDGIKQPLPCGQCIGCRLEKSATWAGRIMNEAQMHMDNIMATFTYSEQHVPWGGCIRYADMQKFYKRLRFKHKNITIRHFTGAEYGDISARPHYHAVIFGYRPQDAVYWTGDEDKKHYISDELTNLWGLGYVQFTDVTFESAQYCAQYCTKKVGGDLAADHYERIDQETGEVYWLPPEQARMSLRPAIGSAWLEKYESDVYPRDEYMPTPGRIIKTPKHYDVLLGRKNSHLLEEIKDRRIKRMRDRAHDNTPDRLKTKEKVTRARLANNKGRGL